MLGQLVVDGIKKFMTTIFTNFVPLMVYVVLSTIGYFQEKQNIQIVKRTFVNLYLYYELQKKCNEQHNLSRVAFDTDQKSFVN